MATRPAPVCAAHHGSLLLRKQAKRNRRYQLSSGVLVRESDSDSGKLEEPACPTAFRRRRLPCLGVAERPIPGLSRGGRRPVFLRYYTPTARQQQPVGRPRRGPSDGSLHSARKAILEAKVGKHFLYAH